jgi:hypothetical protein
MRKILDLKGQKFNRLVAIERFILNKKTYWVCDCACGNKINVELSKLRGSKTQSCGCLQKELMSNRKLDLANKRFGNLTVNKISNKTNSGNYAWLCTCDCGNETIVAGGHLTNGHTKSCGCLWEKSITKHGLHGKPGYTSYLMADPIRKIKRYVGNRVRETMNARYIKKNGNIFDHLPYTVKELKQHLESLWEPWMNWENYGGNLRDMSKKTWHIDHVIPQIKFNFATMNDIAFKECWSLQNLRPLEKMENCKKGYR